ncbi:MAG: polyphosphate kinase 2 family protein [Candidatus Eisenbacteria bacterium]|uniref:Polyphosphate kinase 2 family protein n=1 Tax=Eiseniibacteriota bacterium TaxID=2212470 RepID=A0A538TPZ7_UNCEI|nr:MAG: polyphosphate kinase 2 family protein [Candidatus Eisenbacteria bacterium]
MGRNRLFGNAQRLIKKYRVTDGRSFRLRRVDPGDTGGLTAEAKPSAQAALRNGIDALIRLQDMLYAQDRWALLALFQAMDAAGKDSAIKHVMSGINPAGCQVASFKTPSPEELDHDYLWRCQRELPQRGRIGIFNRSYYEEVLVVRVHPEFLATEKIPPHLVEGDIWDRRYEDIRAFERHLSRNGTIIRKFFLHVSRGEQKRRFLKRLDDPAKQWKFSTADIAERALWKSYMEAYEEMIRATASERAPWYVVPADNKWFTRIIVAAVMVDALGSLELSYPKLTKAQAAELAKTRQMLVDSR